ncbi:MAG: molecular chaperone HtpG [Alphaproteobacteria bacterium]|nr:molecular chaperone HtpG [Alphaproteobacteria bacterium]
MTEKNQQTLKFSAEISKVLQLMIHSLYTNKDIFLRELISNSSDALDKLRYKSLTNAALLDGQSELRIDLFVDKDARTITITDTGIGMSREEMINNLGTIAKSGTQEFLSNLTENGKKEDASALIGQFGVGFYSSFMVADKVSVTSTRAGSPESWQWESRADGEFTIAPATAPAPRGTSITLHLKEGDDQYLDAFRLRHIAQTYSDHISFPISLTDVKENRTDTVNTGSALWSRSKSDITTEQYQEFYHHVAHSPDEPWLTLHNKAEGKLEYTNLLFIPSIKPFDLFHPERKRRVKLFVRRVFITEENVEVVPAYMRFLRGIIDSQDLPLNISRETLQHNPLLAKIRESVVARVLSELKKKSVNDAENYTKFWNNFGPVLKEGLCESVSPKDQILEVCRFYSTNADGITTTSLDEYISRMKPEQEDIYYLTGERIETLRSSAQLEGFVKRGVEVLLLADHVDDFWVNVVTHFKGKKLHSVTRADIDLNKISGEQKAEEEKADKPSDEKLEALCGRIRDILGDSVKDVRTTDKLTSSAVCLAIEDGAMDFRLERFLIEQKQIAAAAAKILEINPNHRIIKSLMARMDDKGADIDDTVWLLFDQARILEGESIGDLAAYTNRVQKLMEKDLAA